MINEYWEDVVDLACAMVEIIRDNSLQSIDGTIDWYVVEDYVVAQYDGPFDGDLFDKAIDLIQDASVRMYEIPEGTTIH